MPAAATIGVAPPKITPSPRFHPQRLIPDRPHKTFDY